MADTLRYEALAQVKRLIENDGKSTIFDPKPTWISDRYNPAYHPTNAKPYDPLNYMEDLTSNGYSLFGNYD